jgi:hypothetical protein
MPQYIKCIFSACYLQQDSRGGRIVLTESSASCEGISIQHILSVRKEMGLRDHLCQQKLKSYHM